MDWPEGATVTVELLEGGKSLEPAQTVELDEGNTSATFEGLELKDKATYSVRETVEGAPSGFSLSTSGNLASGFTLTNRYGKASSTTTSSGSETTTTRTSTPGTSYTTTTGSSPVSSTTRSSTPKTGDPTAAVQLAALLTTGATLVTAGALRRRKRK